jgi:hypothetical protein
MHFMSIEGAARMFLFRPRQSSDPNKRLESHIATQQNPWAEHQNATKYNQSTQSPFIHNHLHDLESLWWVAVWVVFYNHFFESQSSKEACPLNFQQAESQLASARTLFPSIMESAKRLLGFQHSFPQVCSDLPSNKQAICNGLDILRESLIDHYLNVELTLPRSVNLAASGDDIYDIFRKLFSEAQKTYAGCILTFIPGVYDKLRANLKRPRAESTSDTGGATPKKK